MITTVPNLLTMSRILVLPALIASFYMDGPFANWLALTVFVAAGLTDFLDGYIARATGQQSKLGQFLDPVADKLLVVTALLMLSAVGRIDGLDLVAAVVILCREVMVSGLREFLAGLEVSVPVTQLAKWKTAVQITAIAFLLLGDAAPWGVNAVTIGIVGLWIAASLTLYTGYDYLKAGLAHMTPEA